MQTVTINKTQYSIKTEWSEVTAKEFYELRHEHTPEHLLTTLSNIPKELLDQMQDFQKESFLPIFKLDLERLEGKAKPIALDIAKESYEKLEIARVQLRLAENITYILPKLAEIYGIEIDWDKPIEKIVTQGMYILQSILTFLKKFEILWSEEPTDEQKDAGIERLAAFGSSATVYELAGGNILNFQKVLDQPAGEVYQYLLYKHTRSEYENNLIEIQERARNIQKSS
jgi:hypothetical protein